MTNKDIDHVTGVEMTGHVWDDDLRELNKPLPRWWVWTFYATIAWAIVYMILYPAWPTLASYTKGVLGYSQRATVAEDLRTAKQGQAKYLAALESSTLADIRSNPDLLQFARAGGAAAFGTNCAPCHGRGAQGAAGYPNLNDDDWLWGGKLEDVERTIQFGIRSDHKDTRVGDMPKFGIDKLLDAKQISDAAEAVLALSGRATDQAAAENGKKIFADQCAVCHGEDGKGNQELGAPNLTDSIWLYGGTKEAIMEQIRTGRGGVMPAWAGRLDPVTIKMLALYVHSLGGGK